MREAAAVHAAVEALRAEVDQLDVEPGRGAAAVAWHAASVMRFLCSTHGGVVTGLRVNEDSFVVLRAEAPADDVIDVTIAARRVRGNSEESLREWRRQAAYPIRQPEKVRS